MRRIRQDVSTSWSACMAGDGLSSHERPSLVHWYAAQRREVTEEGGSERRSAMCPQHHRLHPSAAQDKLPGISSRSFYSQDSFSKHSYPLEILGK